MPIDIFHEKWYNTRKISRQDGYTEVRSMKKNTTNQFLIGSWVSFYPFEIHSYEYQLDQMAEAGLNFNIFPAVFGGGMLDAETWDNVEKQYEVQNIQHADQTASELGRQPDTLCLAARKGA